VAKPKDGFAYVECEDCGHRYLVPFSCKTRMCPSCGQNRLLEWSEWLFEEVLLNVEHRRWVFTIPSFCGGVSDFIVSYLGI
jgi:RNA polymerase subunit RPABC4/transcription elongation factor Spt4